MERRVTKIRFRRDTSVNFTTFNTILEEGEVALETDTQKLKIGMLDSYANPIPWNSLEYHTLDSEYVKLDSEVIKILGNITKKIKSSRAYDAYSNPINQEDFNNIVARVLDGLETIEFYDELNQEIKDREDADKELEDLINKAVFEMESLTPALHIDPYNVDAYGNVEKHQFSIDTAQPNDPNDPGNNGLDGLISADDKYKLDTYQSQIDNLFQEVDNLVTLKLSAVYTFDITYDSGFYTADPIDSGSVGSVIEIKISFEDQALESHNIEFSTISYGDYIEILNVEDKTFGLYQINQDPLIDSEGIVCNVLKVDGNGSPNLGEDAQIRVYTPLGSGGGGTSIEVSAYPSRPRPSQGDLWINENTMKLFVQYDNAWVEVGSSCGGGGSGGGSGSTGDSYVRTFGDTMLGELIFVRSTGDDRAIAFQPVDTQRLEVNIEKPVSPTGDSGVDIILESDLSDNQLRVLNETGSELVKIQADEQIILGGEEVTSTSLLTIDLDDKTQGNVSFQIKGTQGPGYFGDVSLELEHRDLGDVLLYYGPIEENLEVTTKEYVDTSDNNISQTVDELRQELEAISPTYDRGQWNRDHNGNSDGSTITNPGNGRFLLTTNASLYTSDYASTGKLYLNVEDNSGDTHTWGDINTGSYIQLFTLGVDDTLLGEITNVDKSNPTFIIIDINPLQSQGGVSNDGDAINVKIFDISDADPTNYLLLSGGTITGNLNIGNSETQGKLIVQGPNSNTNKNFIVRDKTGTSKFSVDGNGKIYTSHNLSFESDNSALQFKNSTKLKLSDEGGSLYAGGNSTLWWNTDGIGLQKNFFFSDTNYNKADTDDDVGKVFTASKTGPQWKKIPDTNAKVKTGTNTPTLTSGELFFNTNNKTLYIGS